MNAGHLAGNVFHTLHATCERHHWRRLCLLADVLYSGARPDSRAPTALLCPARTPARTLLDL